MSDELERELGEEFYGAVTMGERGQVVIPAQARKKLGIEPGDKLLVHAAGSGHAIVLIPAKRLIAMMRKLEELTAESDLEQEEGPGKGVVSEDRLAHQGAS